MACLIALKICFNFNNIVPPGAIDRNIYSIYLLYCLIKIDNNIVKMYYRNNNLLIRNIKFLPIQIANLNTILQFDIISNSFDNNIDYIDILKKYLLNRLLELHIPIYLHFQYLHLFHHILLLILL